MTFEDDREVICTTNHPFLTPEGDWIVAEQLRDGACVADLRETDGGGGTAVAVRVGARIETRPLTVASVEFVGEHDIQSISTSTGTYVSEGIASHNTRNRITVLAEGRFAWVTYIPAAFAKVTLSFPA
jgi:hypothetical protein